MFQHLTCPLFVAFLRLVILILIMVCTMPDCAHMRDYAKFCTGTSAVCCSRPPDYTHKPSRTHKPPPGCLRPYTHPIDQFIQYSGAVNLTGVLLFCHFLDLLFRLFQGGLFAGDFTGFENIGELAAVVFST